MQTFKGFYHENKAKEKQKVFVKNNKNLYIPCPANGFLDAKWLDKTLKPFSLSIDIQENYLRGR